MAIPPVGKDLQKEQEFRRPEYIRWYCSKWVEATTAFDAEQKGWYFNLLMASALHGDPPGYLDENEDELKVVAQYRDIPREFLDIINKEDRSNCSLLEDLLLKRQGKWLRVRNKFKKSIDFPGKVFNNRLTDVLRDAQRISKSRAEAGKKGGFIRRQGKSKQTKDLEANAQEFSSKSNDDNSYAKNSNLKDLVAIAEQMLVVNPEEEQVSIQNDNLPETLQLEAIVEQMPGNCLANPRTIATNLQQTEQLARIDEIPGSVHSNIHSNNYNTVHDKEKTTVSKNDTVPKSQEDSGGTLFELTPVAPKRDNRFTVRQKAESLFDEEKFAITPSMKKHLEKLYPEFVQGDWDYMTAKFKNVNYGKKYISWKRLFYNFVSNQLSMYGYKPGAFNWRQNQSTPQASTGGQQKQYESAAERSDRLEREADEYSRSLRGGSLGDGAVGEEALPLASDDLG